MFNVSHDISANLIEVTLAGFFDAAEAARYEAAVETIIVRAAARRNGYAILLDLSDCAIQSKEVVAGFQAHVARVPSARRCAVVAGSSIIRMQARRIVTGPTMKIFESRGPARTWALEPIIPSLANAEDRPVLRAAG